MKHIKQPDGSKLCGQTCTAMVTNTHLANVVAVIGFKGTHYKTLDTAMRKLGKGKLGPIIQRRSAESDFPAKGTYIARLQISKKPHRSHFVALKDGKVYDPEWGFAVPYPYWIMGIRENVRVPDLKFTSWAEYIQ